MGGTTKPLTHRLCKQSKNMQVGILSNSQKQALQAQPANQRGKVTVSLNPVRERIMLDIDGNQIDPRSKKIIKLAKDVK